MLSFSDPIDFNQQKCVCFWSGTMKLYRLFFEHLLNTKKYCSLNVELIKRKLSTGWAKNEIFLNYLYNYKKKADY